MITIDALRICDGERTPLDGVTMLLTANAVHGIAGEGRSELLRAVYGLAVPESGSVTSGGHPLRRRDMAYLEAEPRFWPGLTAGDCLGLVRRYHPASDPAPLLRRLPVPPAAEAAALPPNERKRLALILLSSVLFSFVEVTNTFARIGLHLLLLPVIVSLTYELNRVVGRYDNRLTRLVSAPGMWLQNWTTFEPDDSMIECAIRSLELVLPSEKGKDEW